MNTGHLPLIQQPTRGKTNQAAVASFIMAIVPIIGRSSHVRGSAPMDRTTAIVWVVFSTSAALFAIVAGIAALIQMRKSQSKGKGWAIAGICIGSLQILAFVVTFIVVSGLR